MVRAISASIIALTVSVLADAAREELQRPLLHYTPLDHYMHLPAAIHRFGDDLHIYYSKGVAKSIQQSSVRDWGHVSTSDFSTFTEYSSKFLTLDTTAEASIESGAFLPQSALVDGRHVFFYEAINGANQVAIRSRIADNASTAQPIAEQPTGVITMTNTAPKLFPTAFTFNNVSYIGYLSGGGTSATTIMFKRVSVDGDAIKFTDAGSFASPTKNFCRSLQIFPIGSTSSPKYVIIMSELDGIDGVEGDHYYPNYAVGTFAIIGNNLVFSSIIGGAMDLGHDATDWKVESFDVNGVYKAAAVAVASNFYTTSAIPTTPWRNGLTLVRTLELGSDNRLKQSYGLNASYMSAMQEIVASPGGTLPNTCSNVINFSLDESHGAYQLMLTFNAAYITNGGISIDLYSSQATDKGMTFLVVPDATNGVTGILVTIKRQGQAADFPTTRSVKVPSTHTSFTGKDFHIIVDTTSVEIFMEAGAFVVSENYFTSMLDMMCVKAVQTGQQVSLQALESHKYRSLFVDIGAASTFYAIYALAAAVGASLFL